MILYKYLPPARADLLKHRRIRFTQPGDFNDPFEFRPKICEVASDADVQTYVEEHFEQLVVSNLWRRNWPSMAPSRSSCLGLT